VAGNGPAAATPRRHVAVHAVQPHAAPNTASQLLRLDPATGTVLDATPVDLAGTAIAAYAADSIAAAGTSIGPSAEAVAAVTAISPAARAAASGRPGRGMPP
jgi:hypothetical protein